VVAEGLLDLGDGHLVLDGDFHLVVEHGQGRQLLLGRDQKAAGLGGGGRQQDQQDGQEASHG
jgi:hypothetical protein